MDDDRESTTLHFSPRLAGRQDVLVLGEQTCAHCGHRQICAWPVATDVDADTFECGRCGEMEARFMVAHPLEDFPDYDVTVRSRTAWLACAPRAPYRES